MQLPNNHNAAAKKTAWLLCAVALNALEFFVPRLPFFPWLKPGLANIITILWIVEFGAVDAVVFSLLRVWIVGFYFGFSFVTMSLALTGGVLSTIVMGIAWRAFVRGAAMGTVGLGITGALFHNAGQLLAVYALMAANMRLFYQLPVMLAASVIFGGLVGGLEPFAYRVLDVDVPVRGNARTPALARTATRRDAVFSALVLAGCMGLVFTHSIPALALSAAGSSLIAQIIARGSFRALVKPATGFWVLFAVVACIDLFFSYGAAIPGVPFVTREGAALTLMQWLRLWAWLQASLILTNFNFNAVVLNTLSRAFRGHKETILAGVLALEYFPRIAADGRNLMGARTAAFFSLRNRNATYANRATGRKKGLAALSETLYGLVLAGMREGGATENEPRSPSRA